MGKQRENGMHPSVRQGCSAQPPPSLKHPVELVEKDTCSHKQRRGRVLGPLSPSPSATLDVRALDLSSSLTSSSLAPPTHCRLISLHAIEGHKQRPLADDMMMGKVGRKSVLGCAENRAPIDKSQASRRASGVPCARPGSELQ